MRARLMTVESETKMNSGELKKTKKYTDLGNLLKKFLKILWKVYEYFMQI